MISRLRSSKAALVAFATGAVAFLPGVGAMLELERGAVLAGEGWRFLTGHFVHWTGDQAAWDISTFLVLAWTAEGMAARRTWVAVGLSIAAIGAAFWWLEPALASYRGLSGIDCALGALIASELIRDAHRRGRAREMLLAAGVAAFLAGKITWEVATGGTLFVSSMGPGVVAVPIAHAAGALAGLLAAAIPRLPTLFVERVTNGVDLSG